uniref:Nitroreductase domain-containing protein n=1 Tax=Heterosigma akashiwo TaxID=2829 RepID=A0A7S4DH27_HETAK
MKTLCHWCPLQLNQRAFFSATTTNTSTRAQVFKEIVLSRRSATKFDDNEVPQAVLDDIMELSLRAPSSFNAQPWGCVLVGGAGRADLAACMLGGNGAKVLQAPHTSVFLANTDTVGQAVEIANWMKQDHNGDPTFCARLPHMVGLLSGGGPLVGHAKDLLLTGLSPLQPMPTPNAPEAWAFKNTMLFVQTFILGCTAHGLASAPMEGFDARRIKVCLGIPDHYSIPIVVPFGYPKNDSEEKTKKNIPTPRLDLKRVFFSNKFGAESPSSISSPKQHKEEDAEEGDKNGA